MTENQGFETGQTTGQTGNNDKIHQGGEDGFPPIVSQGLFDLSSDFFVGHHNESDMDVLFCCFDFLETGCTRNALHLQTTIGFGEVIAMRRTRKIHFEMVTYPYFGTAGSALIQFQ